MSKIRVLMCPTDRAPYITNIENSQRNMERIVGGPIQSTKLSHSLHIVLVHNAEGRIRDLPQNHSMPNPQIFGHAEGEYGIHGDCFLCGVIGYAGEEDFTNLPEPRSQWLRSAKDMWFAWEVSRGHYVTVYIDESKVVDLQAGKIMRKVKKALTAIGYSASYGVKVKSEKTING